MAEENISLKIGLDASQFNNSIKGMSTELKALSKVDLTLLSDTDAKAALSRMGQLKDSIGDIKKSVQQADPGGMFESISTLAGPAIASVSAISIGMELFGASTEKVNEIQRKSMMLISIISSLQTLADLDKLKNLAKQLPLQLME
jgi:hypothetical protein